MVKLQPSAFLEYLQSFEKLFQNESLGLFHHWQASIWRAFKELACGDRILEAVAEPVRPRRATVLAAPATPFSFRYASLG
jgi:hypothetical protein